MWINDGPALYLDAKQQEVVPEGDARAAFLLVAAGGQLSDDEANKWGLLGSESKAKKDAPDNKAKTPPPNKAKG